MPYAPGTQQRPCLPECTEKTQQVFPAQFTCSSFYMFICGVRDRRRRNLIGIYNNWHQSRGRRRSRSRSGTTAGIVIWRFVGHSEMSTSGKGDMTGIGIPAVPSQAGKFVTVDVGCLEMRAWSGNSIFHSFFWLRCAWRCRLLCLVTLPRGRFISPSLQGSRALCRLHLFGVGNHKHHLFLSISCSRQSLKRTGSRKERTTLLYRRDSL